MEHKLLIELAFQRSGYTDDEVGTYKHLFADLSFTKSRTYVQPAAGHAFGLDVLINFLEEVVLSGIAYDILKTLSIRLVKLFSEKEQRVSCGPEMTEICLSFQDKDIVLGIDDLGSLSPDAYAVNKDALAGLSDIYALFRSHFESSPLNGYDFQKIRIPVRSTSEDAKQPLVKRFWKIYPDYGFGYGTYYDMDARAIVSHKPKSETKRGPSPQRRAKPRRR